MHVLIVVFLQTAVATAILLSNIFNGHGQKFLHTIITIVFPAPSPNRTSSAIYDSLIPRYITTGRTTSIHMTNTEKLTSLIPLMVADFTWYQYRLPVALLVKSLSTVKQWHLILVRIQMTGTSTGCMFILPLLLKENQYGCHFTQGEEFTCTMYKL